MSDEQNITMDNNVNLSKLEESDFKEIKSSKLNISTKGIDMSQRSTDKAKDNQSGDESHDSQDFVLDIFVDEDDILNDGAIEEVIHDMQVRNKSLETNTCNAFNQLNCKCFDMAHSVKKEKTPKKKIIFDKDLLTEVQSENKVIVGEATNDYPEKKKKVKLSENNVKETSAEILKKRAERFGITQPQIKKKETRGRKEKRKERFRPNVNSSPRREYKKSKRLERFKSSFKSRKY